MWCMVQAKHLKITESILQQPHWVLENIRPALNLESNCFVESTMLQKKQLAKPTLDLGRSHSADIMQLTSTRNMVRVQVRLAAQQAPHLMRHGPESSPVTIVITVWALGTQTHTHTHVSHIPCGNGHIHANVPLLLSLSLPPPHLYSLDYRNTCSSWK